MGKKSRYSVVILMIILFLGWFFSESDEQQEEFSERVKLSLRAVGNQLLLSNKDSTSLVLPVIDLGNSKYKLSFQQQLFIEPNNLVTIINSQFQKTGLPRSYRIEVIQCIDKEIAYSYEIKKLKKESIIPCKGRILPKNCYTIKVKYTTKKSSFLSKQMFLYFLVSILLIYFLLHRKKQVPTSKKNNEEHIQIGSFQFYPEQNKLTKEAVEISLSKKECELLTIFIANPNQIIKRDYLTKKVWEDKGVIVGRSLDTYISKLRKKLKDDISIKLTNIHGVGYKLEITY